MDHYGGIDVSLELSSVCIVDAQGKIVKEAAGGERGPGDRRMLGDGQRNAGPHARAETNSGISR